MIMTKTPLRASFFGGGSDFADYFHKSTLGHGAVISTAIDMHVYIVVNKRFDDKIRIVYNGNELVNQVDEIKHNIIREALKLTGIESGIEIIYMADIPMTDVGVGLASSSALTVGVLNALHAFKGEFVTPEKLAREACEIEINKIGQRIGIQDQYAVAYGGFNRFYFNADDSVCVLPVTAKMEIIHKLRENLMLIYTGNPRDSRKIFQEQEAKRESKRRDLDDLVETVDRAYAELLNGNIDEWGKELDRTWNIKKQFSSGISNPEIDQMYETAKHAGAFGGKILGAGGGGFLMMYVPEMYREKVRRTMSGYKIYPMAFDSQGSRIIFSD